MNVLQDFDCNNGDARSQVILVMFRLTKTLRQSRHRAVRGCGKVSAVIYRIAVEYVLGVELPWMTEVGPRLRLFHPHGIVINGYSTIGARVRMHQNVTIGAQRHGRDCPVIEDDVQIGAGAIVIGAITIGRGARIGAGAVVTKSMPPGFTAIGNPAAILAPKAVAGG